jgi:hypothetical protein
MEQLQTVLEYALIAGGAAAFAGAAAGVIAFSADVLGAGALPRQARMTLGSWILASHAITAAALWQSPKIGACMAAALGAGWIGASVASLAGMAASERGFAKAAGAAALRAGLGAALLAPLWAYVQIIRLHAAMQSTV